MKRLIGIALLVLGVTGCVGPVGSISDAENDQAALVYGYINGNQGVPNVTLYNDKTKVLAPWAPGNTPAHTYTSGLVVFANVEPGEYTIHGFGIGRTSFGLGEQRIKLTVRPGEIKYLGAYQYAPEGGLFSNEFTFSRTSDPSDQTVLKWAIEATDGTDWNPRLRRLPSKG